MTGASDTRQPLFIHPQATVETDDIGAGTRIWGFTHVMAGVRIGCDVNIGEHCFLETGVTVGDRVTVKNGISLWQGVHVEDDAFLGPHMVFTNDPTPRSKVRRPLEETWVRRGATLGAGSVILSGTELGAACMVGAGAVVTRSVPSYALVYGNPARQHGWACVCGLTLKLDDGAATCVCGERYDLEGHHLRRLES